MIKAAFFDIDGTLLSFKTHKMPESTKRALSALRERGILTIVSSGRPTYQLPPCIATGFDAYITLSGQLCYDRDGVFRSNPISDDGVRRVVQQVKEGRYEALVLQGDRAFCSKLTDDVAEVARNAGLVYEVDDIDRTFDAPVYQFCAFLDGEREHIITDAIPDVATTRWTHLFCDIMPSDGGKLQGGVRPIRHLSRRGDSVWRRRERPLDVRGRGHQRGHGQRMGHGEGARRLRYLVGG